MALVAQTGSGAVTDHDLDTPVAKYIDSLVETYLPDGVPASYHATARASGRGSAHARGVRARTPQSNNEALTHRCTARTCLSLAPCFTARPKHALTSPTRSACCAER
eukprot:2917-Pleurochrysis_carterae.AAC.1